MVLHGDFSLKGERQPRRFGARGSTGPANVDLCFFDPQPAGRGFFTRNKYYEDIICCRAFAKTKKWTSVRGARRGRNDRHPCLMRKHQRCEAILLVMVSAAALRLCLTHQTITVNSSFSLQDPLGGITLFPRVTRASCSAQRDCEFVNPLSDKSSFRKEDKITVVLMGYKPARSHNYLQLFEAYTAMRNTVERVVFIWNNLEIDPPPVPPDVHLIRASRNDMMNRYALTKDYPHTNSILTVDDETSSPARGTT